MPALRERREDIEALAHHFLMKLCRKHNRSVSIDQEALDVLARYPWPGNIRELENVLEPLYWLVEGEGISAVGVEEELQALSRSPSSSGMRASVDPYDIDEQQRSIERAALLKAQEDGLDIAETAKRVARSKRWVYYKMEEFGIKLNRAR